MLDFHNILLFVAASWALIITPGPDMLYVVTNGMSQGRKAGILSAIGVSLGIIVHTFAAAFGLSVLLKTSVVAFLVIKYVGAAYLIYLGIQAFFDKEGLNVTQQKARGKRSSTLFWKGIMTNVLNPKVALFFLAFLPQFVSPTSESTAVQMILLGLLFILFTTLFMSFMGYFSGHIGSWLCRKPWVARRFKWVTGSVFIGLGVRLLFLERR